MKTSIVTHNKNQKALNQSPEFVFIKIHTVKPRLFEVPGTAGILSKNR